MACHRVEHRRDDSIIKCGLMHFLLGSILQNTTGLSIAELLRTGEALERGVRDAQHQGWDSSEGQETWVPSESETSSQSNPDPDFRKRIHWDRELADILGLGNFTELGNSKGDQQTLHGHGQLSDHLGQELGDHSTVQSKKTLSGGGGGSEGLPTRNPRGHQSRRTIGG